MKEENLKALKSMRCPRCGARLYYRDVMDSYGRGISKEFADLFGLCGHNFSIFIKDFIAREAIKK